MKLILLTIFLLSFSTFAAEGEHKIILGTGHSIKEWSERPDTFQKDDVTPPKFSLGWLGIFGKEKNFLDIGIKASFKDKDALFTELNGAWRHQPTALPALQFKLGLNLAAPIISDDSIYNDTQFEHTLFGIYIKVFYQIKFLNFYVGFHGKGFSETTMSRLEGIETKISSGINQSQFGVEGEYRKFTFFADYSIFNFSNADIVSKEFVFRIPKQNVNRIGLGLGYLLGENEIRAKYYSFETPAEDRKSVV